MHQPIINIDRALETSLSVESLTKALDAVERAARKARGRKRDFLIHVSSVHLYWLREHFKIACGF